MINKKNIGAIAAILWILFFIIDKSYDSIAGNAFFRTRQPLSFMRTGVQIAKRFIVFVLIAMNVFFVLKFMSQTEEDTTE